MGLKEWGEESTLDELGEDGFSKGVGGMGFRGISEFNTSLLVKHYWRLLSDDHT